MGNDLIKPLPLPERIPVPEDDVLKAMQDVGVKLYINGEPYIQYSLPAGWKTVDDSVEEDHPDFTIVDDNGQSRFQIYGSWKGNYENWLRCVHIHPPKEYKSKSAGKPLVASSTSSGAVMRTLVVALDEKHRPFKSERVVSRAADFVSAPLVNAASASFDTNDDTPTTTETADDDTPPHESTVDKDPSPKSNKRKAEVLSEDGLSLETSVVDCKKVKTKHRPMATTAATP